MKYYYGIKTPDSENKKGYIWWIASSEFEAWCSFFQFPNPDGDKNFGRYPLYEAIKAYESVGYRCVKVKFDEIIEIKNYSSIVNYEEDFDDATDEEI